MKCWIIAICCLGLFSSGARAGLDEGIAAYEQKDCATADRELRPLAEAGDILAQRMMGWLAVRCKNAASESASYAYAQLALQTSESVEQGYGTAEDRLYVEYTWTSPDMHDPFGAVEWFAKAAAGGDPVAQFMAATLSDRGIGTETDHAGAVAWLEKAADCAEIRADYFLAVHYRDGIGTDVDRRTAFEWFHTGAERGDVDAMAEVGRMYLQGDGVTADYGHALKWLKLSAARNGFSQYYLATMYRDGLGTPKDLVQAYIWFFRAKRAMRPVAIVKAIQDPANDAWAEVSLQLTPAEVKAATEIAVSKPEAAEVTVGDGAPAERRTMCRSAKCCVQ